MQSLAEKWRKTVLSENFHVGENGLGTARILGFGGFACSCGVVSWCPEEETKTGIKTAFMGRLMQI
jgi:hypothetical protein